MADTLDLNPGDKVTIKPGTRNNQGSRPKPATVLGIGHRGRVLVEANFVMGNTVALCLATVDVEDLA